jgi:hypothetical protein
MTTSRFSASGCSDDILDLTVSCPASNASAVRFARWSVGPTGLSQRWLEFPPLIEATPAAPADVPTFQRFGALRNPPVWERGDDTGKPKEAGQIRMTFFDVVGGASLFRSPHAGYAGPLFRMSQQPNLSSARRRGQFAQRIGRGGGHQDEARASIRRSILHDAPSPARFASDLSPSRGRGGRSRDSVSSGI